ncbi:MAG: hypothetical protein EXR51_01800 [Dehalococcoidia bacterium]|nr:hypothetical protein [Dehalococcoidia bacterium]
MAELPRLNGVIRALEQGQTAFVTFSTADPASAQAINAAPYDGVVFEMEHNIYDIKTLTAGILRSSRPVAHGPEG